MALIIPPGFAHAVWTYRLTGDAEAMVTTCGLDVGAYAGDFQEAANAAHGNWVVSTGPIGNLPNTYTVESCTLYVGQDGGPPAVFESTGASVPGASTGAALPQNTALLVRKRTSAAGRRGRGRFYVPGLQESLVSPAGVIGNDDRNAIQARWDILFDRFENGATGVDPLPMVVLHDSAGAGEEPAPTPITVLQVDSLVATQRQRLRR